MSVLSKYFATRERASVGPVNEKSEIQYSLYLLASWFLLRELGLTLSGPGFEKLAQTGGGADSGSPS